MYLPEHSSLEGTALSMIDAARAAARLIPPAFPLAATVAVNPYMGHSTQSLSQTDAALGRAAGLRVTLPRAWFRAQMAAGHLTLADIEAALDTSPDAGTLSARHVEHALNHDRPAPQALPTVAELAQRATGIDWPAIVARCIGGWAASWFDQGQALWPAPRGRGAYDAWRNYAIHDLTPEICGLSGFAARVNDSADEAAIALARCAVALGLTPESAGSVFHRALMDLGGWAQAARWKLWQAELDGGRDDSVTDLLAIRLVWDGALLAQYQDLIGADWAEVVAQHAQKLEPDTEACIDAVLQAAMEHAYERNLRATLASVALPPAQARPALQAAFCIDVRSEPLRRALESCDAGVQTIGFAGFFGLPLAHRPKGACGHEAHVPVLLTPALSTEPQASDALDQSARIAARATRIWGRFKLAAVSSFAFVEATGPLYAGKLVRDALGLHPVPAPEPDPVLAGLDAAGRVDVAAKVLGAMGLTGPFAPVVLLVGHGAHVTNNAHASALQCGACGGHSGEVSARALAGLLNDAEVRTGLAARGLVVPTDTQFVAGLHDTVSDKVALFGSVPAHVAEWLERAGALVRAERAAKLPRAGKAGADIPARAHDWAEARPEWGLAGCAAFIAAPRAITRGRNLGGRTFLHDYHAPSDAGYQVLELILTAPVVVASWISLQYYGSVTAPDAFGAGNKLLHNVVGGFGVFEGNSTTPRVGLSWQSVHDGARLMHEPLRLTVAIAAPQSAMEDILSRHPNVRALFDNGWLRLVQLDDQGQMVARRLGAGRGWCTI